jgi:hypothetical protein
MTDSLGSNMTPEVIAQYQQQERREKAWTTFGMIMGSMVTFTLIALVIIGWLR